MQNSSESPMDVRANKGIKSARSDGGTQCLCVCIYRGGICQIHTHLRKGVWGKVSNKAIKQRAHYMELWMAPKGGYKRS